ncbi:hypothetical protein DFO55_101712 [Grimontella sp. AG753]|nr:hypothetical protein DFO55_101712 [Grimontella sp. AG753]
MKLIKYWHVKLYRNLSTSIFSEPMEKLILEGYSSDIPVLEYKETSLLKLFTKPNELEVKTIRTCAIDSMVCTPVYEEDEPLETEIDSNKHVLKSDFFTIEIQVPTAEDLNKIFAEVCRDISHLTPSHSVFTAVFEEVMKRVNASISASMTTNPKLSNHPNAFRGKQITPIEDPLDDKAAADSQEAKSRYDYNSFKSASKPLVKWLNENANPHATVIVEVDGATLYSAESHAPVREFLKD